MRDAVYYLLKDVKMEKLKPSQKAAISAMDNNADMVQTFIKSSKIDFKSDKDLAKLFIYYNSL